MAGCGGLSKRSVQLESRPRQRDPYFDNVRAVLITFVVIGHALEGMSSNLGDAVYLWIYSFHMPAFVIVTGYLSKTYRGSPRQYERMVSTLLLPFLIFQTYQLVVRVLVNGSSLTFNFWQPGWTLWFLVALLIWRLITPIFKIIRYPLMFAVVISVLAPLDVGTDGFLAWGRVLSFLPFFVLGLLLERRHFEWLKTAHVKTLAAVVLIAGLGAAFLLNGHLARSVLHMSRTYEYMKLEPGKAMLIRIIVLAAALLLSGAVFVLAPRKQFWGTSIGKHSLTIYLIHAAVIFPLRFTDFFGSLTGVGKIAVIGSSFLLVYLVSRAAFVRATTWLTSPPLRPWLIAYPEEPTPEASPRSKAAGAEK